MASKRMMSKELIMSDKFTAMSVAAQLLYIRLLVSADDEGFISNVKMLSKGKSSVNSLIENQFIYRFDSNVILIKHWFVHNRIRKDMFKPTACKAEKALVTLDSDKIYQLADPLRSRNETVTQYSIGKDSIDKIRESNPTVASGEARSPDIYSEEFLLFWNAYPNKSDKLKAFTEFKKVDVSVQTLLEAVEKQKKTPQWANDDGLFIPKPVNWLKRRGWEDVIQPPQKECGANGHLGKEELAAIQRALQEGIEN